MNSSLSNIHFCDHCHNLTTIGVQEETRSLIHYCKGCNQEESVDPQDLCIYKISFKDTDMKHTLNQNKYLTHDVSLPKIHSNPNLKCLNEDCDSHNQSDSTITYIKHDPLNLRYIYICDLCGQRWTND